ncbi:hypothetical protein FACS1894176_02850 [Bacteroidia bacterium]|nr:hypothetical protein FACS1894176_02850 [Bacteroidia bacterium]
MKQKILILSLLLLAAVASMDAQVTIGGGGTPKDGAVLDLSQSGSLGLILPRAALKNATHYQLGTSITRALDSYPDGTGSVVYNDGTDALQPAGIYVWNGTDWCLFNTVVDLVIDPSSLLLSSPNETQQLNLVWSNPAPTDKNVTWVSSNPAVASVTDGLVTAHFVGSTTITATTVDGKTATSEIDVDNEIVCMTIALSKAVCESLSNDCYWWGYCQPKSCAVLYPQDQCTSTFLDGQCTWDAGTDKCKKSAP